MKINHQTLIENFAKLSENLIFPSESDFPIIPFYWDLKIEKTIDKTLILSHLEKPLDTPITEESIDDFFKNVITLKDWYGEDEIADAQRFEVLLWTLKHELQDIQVFKIGEIEIEVYVVGKAKMSGFAGISTKLVQT